MIRSSLFFSPSVCKCCWDQMTLGDRLSSRISWCQTRRPVCKGHARCTPGTCGIVLWQCPCLILSSLGWFFFNLISNVKQLSVVVCLMLLLLLCSGVIFFPFFFFFNSWGPIHFVCLYFYIGVRFTLAVFIFLKWGKIYSCLFHEILRFFSLIFNVFL